LCLERHERYLRERELGFDNDFGVRSKLPGYNALQDENMTRFFENSQIQKHLWKTGQVSTSALRSNQTRDIFFHTCFQNLFPYRH